MIKRIVEFVNGTTEEFIDYDLLIAEGIAQLSRDNHSVDIPLHNIHSINSYED